jgi:hypothetical protein
LILDITPRLLFSSYSKAWSLPAKMSHEQATSSSAASVIDTEQHLPSKSDAQYPSDTKGVAGSVNDTSSDDMPDDNAQYGVKAMEGVTLAWTKKTLATAYIL